MKTTNDEKSLLLLKSLYDLTDDQFQMFLLDHQVYDLDPAHRLIVPLRNRDGSKTNFLTLAARRLSAFRTGEYVGREGPFWCDAEGKWSDVWLSDEPPAVAKVGIRRKGFPEPAWGQVTWNEYARWKKGKGGARIYTRFWRLMPSHMLAVAAERKAYSIAFPDLMVGRALKEESVIAPGELRLAAEV